MTETIGMGACIDPDELPNMPDIYDDALLTPVGNEGAPVVYNSLVARVFGMLGLTEQGGSDE